VRQYTEGVVGSIIWILLEIYFSFQQWKNFENLLRIDEVIAMNWCTTFLGHSVYHAVLLLIHYWLIDWLLLLLLFIIIIIKKSKDYSDT